MLQLQPLVVAELIVVADVTAVAAAALGLDFVLLLQLQLQVVAEPDVVVVAAVTPVGFPAVQLIPLLLE